MIVLPRCAPCNHSWTTSGSPTAGATVTGATCGPTNRSPAASAPPERFLSDADIGLFFVGDSVMKVVIFAGGMGTRLSEETAVRPKPMVEIGGGPTPWAVMKIYPQTGG